ncbi:MAG: putative glycoside hydrolase [Faecalibacterium sp.]|nr:putative glycoside hydrolase [Ruminococcus sp.]MCM1392741.1 putative glycoside hydrolase [Ruminococcus sp.]MCM1486303.1 putative glycoside hydrolase [Faecalibacterium sp.]
MAFKKSIYGHSSSKKNGVRVKNSYYTFSKEYPAGNIGITRKADRQKKKRSAWMHAVVYIICFAVIVSAAFFIVDLGLKFSYKAVPESSDTPSVSVQDEKTSPTLLHETGVKALYMPTEKLGDSKYIKKLIGKIKAKDANSVVIDFKTQDGRLAYTSSAGYAMLGKCAIFDNETVRKAIDSFTNSKINVIAGIHCFEDSIVSSQNSDLAVKYMNSDVTWLDKREEDGGKPWLNPYSNNAREYINQIISEVSEMGVNGFLLKSVCFPESDYSDTAGYPGEKNQSERNGILLSFIKSVKKVLPASTFVCIFQNADDALNGNEKLYFGSIAKNDADGICVDTSERPESYVVDKKTDFSSMMSLYANIKQGMNESSALIPMIHMDEYSRRYVKTVTRGGYDSYILYDANGEY